MILKGLNKADLQQCLDSCQELYDNNLMFNRLNLSGYKRNKRGIEAVEMEDAVIFAKFEGKRFVIPIYTSREWKRKYIPNPFIENQVYFAVKGSANTFNVYVSNCENGAEIFHMTSYCKDIRDVVDFLKNNINPNQITFTLRVRDSKKAGHRVGQHLTSKGNRRRLISACWHVHEDVMKAIFKMNPNAKLKTSMAYYKNHDDFYLKYPETGNANVGSQMYPVCMEELCECHG